MNKLFIISTALLLCGNALAYGEAGRWSSGWGQGTSEYTAVVNEQNHLYIACNDTRKVSMTATVQGKEYGSYAGQAFSIIVDGSQYDAPYETESRVGENNFFDMWGKLRQAKSISIVTPDGKQLALPTKEVASVLPATGTPDFGCLMWDESEEPAPAAPSTPPAPVTATLPSSTFDVSWKIEYMLNMPAKMLQIVSHHDNITIQNATINRGNCPFPLEKLPLTFRFGGTAKFFVPQKCNILEVHVFTNQGEALYQFDSQS